jgi:hypothetical protein
MMTVVMVVTSCRAYEADCQQDKQSNGFHNFSFCFDAEERLIKSLHNSFFSMTIRADNVPVLAVRKRLHFARDYLTRRRETAGRFGERVETIDQKVELPSALRDLRG